METRKKEENYNGFIAVFITKMQSKLATGELNKENIEKYFSSEVHNTIFQEVLSEFDDIKNPITKERIKSAVKDLVNDNIMFFVDSKNTLYLKMRRLYAEVLRRDKNATDLRWIVDAFEPESIDDLEFTREPYYPYNWFDKIVLELYQENDSKKGFAALSDFLKKHSKGKIVDKKAPLTEETAYVVGAEIIDKTLQSEEKRVSTSMRRERYDDFAAKYKPLSLAFLYTQAYGMKLNDSERETLVSTFTQQQLAEFNGIKEKYLVKKVETSDNK